MALVPYLYGIYNFPAAPTAHTAGAYVKFEIRIIIISDFSQNQIAFAASNAENSLTIIVIIIIIIVIRCARKKREFFRKLERGGRNTKWKFAFQTNLLNVIKTIIVASRSQNVRVAWFSKVHTHTHSLQLRMCIMHTKCACVKSWYSVLRFYPLLRIYTRMHTGIAKAQPNYAKAAAAATTVIVFHN